MFISSSISGEGMRMRGHEGTVTCRLVYPACYAAMGLKGDTHKEYVVKCAKAGQAFYILDETNDVLY